jgi:salicylate hydroxylase
MTMRVLIVGGGIGGVAAALALARAGIDVEVLEREPVLGEIGAGVQISANGTKALRHLGLEPALPRVGIAPSLVSFADMTSGRELFRSPLGPEAAEHYGAGFFQMHRADLLRLLADALPAGVVRLGARVTGVRLGEREVTALLDDGSEVHGDALVGADGLRSHVREVLLAPEQPEFIGTLGWRALIERSVAEPLGLERWCYAWLGPQRSMVVYWVRGGELVNLVGFVPAQEVRRESWVTSGDVEGMRRSFAGCCPQVSDIVAAVSEAFITGVFHRAPLERWTVGRATLLGDAAHPPLPFLAQGACQALEDAVVLGECLRGCTPAEAPGALARYERLRRPRTTKVQAVAAAAERFWHQTDPMQIRARDGRFRGIARVDPFTETVWGWLYHHDPAAAVADSEQPRGLATATDERVLRRPQARRAFALWRDALTPADHAGGWNGLRAGYERFLREGFPAPDGIVSRALEGSPVPGRSIAPAGGAQTARVALHLHGGGYMLGSAGASQELAARIAAALRGSCVVCDYRLAPEHPFPAASDDALAAYRWLLEDGHDPADIVLTGESAGGALAVITAMRAREQGLPAPAAVHAVSPFADLALTSPSIDAHEGRDPAVGRDLLTDLSGSYLQGHDPRDPLASPVYGDLAGLPPLVVHAAAEEALTDDAVRLAARAEECGVPVELRLVPDTVHAFVLFAFLEEAGEVLARL